MQDTSTGQNQDLQYTYYFNSWQGLQLEKVNNSFMLDILIHEVVLTKFFG